MARTGRYCYCPMAGKIHRNAPTLIERIRRWKTRKNEKFMITFSDYQTPCYPTGYFKNQRR